MNWILGRLKWGVAAAALGGPFFAFMGFNETATFKKLEEEGVKAQAYITGATETSRRRGATSYDVDLVWFDKAGEERKAANVDISSSFAREMIQGDEIVVDVIPIRYLEDDTSVDPVVINSLQAQKETAQFMTYGGAATGGVGWLGGLLWFLLGRRKSSDVEAG